MEVNGADLAGFIKPTRTALKRGRDGCPCPLLQACMAMHGEHMEAQPPMGLEGDSGEGGVRSYQATSDAQGEAVVHGGARGCMEVQKD